MAGIHVKVWPKCGHEVLMGIRSKHLNSIPPAIYHRQLWRWRRDLNPRTVLAVTRFRGVLLRPLGHATAEQLTESATVHPNRWRAKKASSGAAHSPASTPPRTAGRWLSRRSRTTSHSDPTAPVLGSRAPHTSRSMRASTRAPAHMIHGSTVTASVAPSSRHPSPSTPAAARIARTSACAVGSPKASRAFTARASSVPSAPLTTAPIGTSRGPAVAATASAVRIRSSSVVTDRGDGGDPLRPAPPRLRSPTGPDGGDPLRPAPPRLRSPTEAVDHRRQLLSETHFTGDAAQLL